MARIGIEINGVLRDTIGKLISVYQKYLIDDVLELESTDDFTYEMSLPVTSLNISEHFKFKSNEELYSFLYEEFPLQIFGHAGSPEPTTFDDLNELYLTFRDDHDIVIVSDEIGKSKPATLFFLSKFGCLAERIFFYSTITQNSMWDNVDILVTANPDLIVNAPADKTIIMYATEYNTNVDSTHSVTSIKGLKDKLKQIL